MERRKILEDEKPYVVGEDLSGAIFQKCGANYRYALWRKWNRLLPIVQYIGLNPSKATEFKNDRTISRLVKFTQQNGFGGFYMKNLFAYISPYPEDLISSVYNTIGDYNDDYLLNYGITTKTVFCWGGFKEAYKSVEGNKSRAEKVIQMFPDAWCFGMNDDGSPKHPLYLKQTTTLQRFANAKLEQNPT